MHASGEKNRRTAREYILEELNQSEGLALLRKPVELPGEIFVSLGGYDETSSALCEIYTHTGILTDSQLDELASDLMKMVFIEKASNRSFRKVFCFISGEASAHVSGGGWLAHATRLFNIETKVVRLPKDLELSLKKVYTS